MLTGIGLRNFKAFGDEMQEAPLSKITLIYGPNSGGKSSIIQALLLLKQSLKTQYIRRFESYKRELVLKGELTDLNSIQSLLHKHESERILGISVRFKNLRLVGRAENSVAMSFVDDHSSAHMSEVRYAITSCEDEKMLFSASSDMMKHGKIAANSRIPYDGFEEREAAPFRILNISGTKSSYLAWTEFIPSLYFPEFEQARMKEFENGKWETEKFDGLLEAQESTYTLRFACDMAEGWPVDEDLGKALGQLELSLAELVALTPENIVPEYNRHVRSVNYLGPLRSAPQRIYRPSSELDSFEDRTGSQGEFSANVLYGNDLVGTTHQWIVKDAVNQWFDQFEIPYKLDVVKLGEASLAGEYLTIALTDKRTDTQVTLADVGYGINQLLPVIIEGIASQESSILCVEQPEIHLHPRLQANIADLMIDTIVDEPGKRKQWIVETHSELLITRIQRRIREGKIKSEDISVLYVDPDAEHTEGSAIIPLRMDENGDFIDHWPHGFFDEAFNELTAEPEDAPPHPLNSIRGNGAAESAQSKESPND